MTSTTGYNETKNLNKLPLYNINAWKGDTTKVIINVAEAVMEVCGQTRWCTHYKCCYCCWCNAHSYNKCG